MSQTQRHAEQIQQIRNEYRFLLKRIQLGNSENRFKNQKSEIEIQMNNSQAAPKYIKNITVLQIIHIPENVAKVAVEVEVEVVVGEGRVVL